MNTTWFEKGVIKGDLQGRRDLLKEQLEECFGPLPLAALERLNELDFDELRALGKSILRAKSLDELGLQGERAE